MPKKGQKKVQLELTKKQRAMLKELFGHDVETLSVSVEEFPTGKSKKASKLRVLKVDNIAAIQHAVGTLGDVVN